MAEAGPYPSIVTGAVPFGAPGRLLERQLALQQLGLKWGSQTARLSRSFSLATPLVESSRSIGSCPANAAFLPFVPGREFRSLELIPAKKLPGSAVIFFRKKPARAGARRRGKDAS